LLNKKIEGAYVSFKETLREVNVFFPLINIKFISINIIGIKLR